MPWQAPRLTSPVAELARQLARSQPILRLDRLEAALAPAPSTTSPLSSFEDGSPLPAATTLLLRLGNGRAQLTVPPALVWHLLTTLDPAAPSATGELAGLLFELAADPLLQLFSGLPGLVMQLADPNETWNGSSQPAMAVAVALYEGDGTHKEKSVAAARSLGTCFLVLDEDARASLSIVLTKLPARRTPLPAALPVTLHVRVLATDLTWAELRGIAPGDVILASRRLPNRAVLLVAGGERLTWRASLSQSGHPGGGSKVRLEAGPLLLASSHGDWTMTQSTNDLRQNPSSNSPGDHASSPLAGTLDELPVRVVFELGRMELPLSELETVGPGHVFELARDEKQPIDIIANGLRVGGGEIVSVAGQLGVRVLWIGGGRRE